MCLLPRPISSNPTGHGAPLLLASLLPASPALSPPMTTFSYVTDCCSPSLSEAHLISCYLPKPSVAPHCSQNEVRAPRPNPNFSLPSNLLQASSAQGKPNTNCPAFESLLVLPTWFVLRTSPPPPPTGFCAAQLREARVPQRQCDQHPLELANAQPAQLYLSAQSSGSYISPHCFPPRKTGFLSSRTDIFGQIILRCGELSCPRYDA